MRSTSGRPLHRRRRRGAVGLGVVALLALVAATTSGFSLALDYGAGGLTPGAPGANLTAPAAPAAKASAALAVSPTSGPVGTLLTFTGTSFADSKAFTVTNPSGTVVCSGTTSSTGGFTCAYTVPPTPGGPQTFTAEDSKKHKAPATFTVESALVASPRSGAFGTPIRFLGTGFGGTTPYVVDVNWTTPTGEDRTACSGTTASSLNGTFGCSFVLPAAPGGSHTFTAISTGSGRSAYTATTTFSVLSGLTLGPSNGPPGTRVTFAGYGFGGSDQVSVTWADGTACTTTSLVTGNFSCSTTIPSGTTGGVYSFTASDADGNSASATFTVTYLLEHPGTASVNSTLTFAGGGFTPSAAVTLSWTGGSICAPLVASATGTFTCTYKVPPTPHGTYTFTAADGSGNHASATVNIGASLVLNVTRGDPGTPVRFAGTGFGGSVAVNVTWAPTGGAATACSVTTASNGSFDCAFTIPHGTAGGPYTFQATDHDGNTASAAFTVTYLSASPVSGPLGTSVTLVGGGFTPASTFSVSWGPNSIPATDCTSTVVSASGGFKCTYSTVAAPAGAQAFTASDTDHHNATAPFTVVPHLGVSPSSGNVSVHLTFSLTGFAASSPTTVRWANGTRACSGETSPIGSTTCTVALVPIPAGAYAFRANDSAGHNASVVFTLTPSLSVSPGHGLGGTSVTFHGLGFGSNVSVGLSSSLGTVCTTRTSLIGSFSCAYTIPTAPSGSYTFTAVDGLANSATTKFAVTPVLTVSAPKGPVGTLLTFHGYGFGVGRLANITWSQGTACSGSVGVSGEFSCSFSVPAAGKGNYTFTADDLASGHGGNTASVSFAVVPTLTVSPTSGPVGQKVTFVGSGYLADALVAVHWTIGTACSNESGPTGAFSCRYVIPSEAAGAHEFTGSSSALDSANASFRIVPTLAISRSSGPIGTTVWLNASGVAASAWLNISWSDGIACSGEASAQGLYSCVYVVAPATAGAHTFALTIATVAVANASFRVVSTLALSPTAGPDATVVAFTALGFAGSSQVTISSSLGPTCQGESSARGSYACNYTIPTAPAGTYSFLAEDGDSNQATAPFVVGSVLTVAPKSGVVGSAVEFSGSGFAGSTSITVSWSGGAVCSSHTDASGAFSCNTTAPLAPFGPHVFTATAGPSATATFSTRPAVTADPTFGEAGGSTTFSGNGFSAGSTVTVTWAGTTTCSASSNSSGQFSCRLAIPLSTPGGTYTFTATDLLGHEANTTFNVTTGLLAYPSHGPPLTSVTFTGTNFVAGQTAYVNWTAGPVCNAVVGVSGTFSCTSAIPAGTPGGAYRFTAMSGATESSVRFVVTYLNATPTGVVPGGYIELSAGGFEPDQGFQVSAPWGLACEGTADLAGAFSCRVEVPATLAPGAYNFSANDSFGDVATAGFGVFTVAAPLASRASVDVNQTVTFSVAASGGTGSLSYAWVGLPHGCLSVNASAVVCQPDRPNATVSITVLVTDPAGFTVTSPALAYVVYPDPTVTVPAPSAPSADVGQTISFSTGGSVGSGAPVYQWTESGLGLNCTLTDLNGISCSPNTVGNYTVSVNVTDSNGVTSATRSHALYRVYSRPVAVVPAANRTSLDVGQGVSFTSRTDGGSGGETYAWSAPTALGCTATTSATLACRPTGTGTYSVSVTVTDSNGVTSGAAVSGDVTVLTAPATTTPKGNVSAADVGQAVAFTTSASGGAGGYQFTWTTAAGLNCTSTTTATLDCVPLDSGTYTVSVRVTDANGAVSATESLTGFVVSPALVVPTPTATPPSVDLRQSVTFSVSASGGAGSYTYTWAGLPVGCSSTAASFSCTPTRVNTSVEVNVTVTDANGFSVTSPTLAFAVYPIPTQAPPTVAPASADVGQSVVFTASVTGGSGGGTYVWSAAGLNCTSSTGPKLACIPDAAGGFTVSYAWTDSNGVAAGGSTSATYTVWALPSLTTPAPAPASVDVGQKLTFSTTLSGGSGGPVFSWTESGAGLNCTLANADVISCAPSAAGNYTVTVRVTDSNGGTSPSHTSAQVEVFRALSLTAPVPSLPSVDIGEPFTFTTTVSGGSGSPVFSWTTPSALGCSASTTDTISCTPTSSASGSYTVTVGVTDSNHGTSAPATSEPVSVLPPPKAAVPTPSRPSVDIGQSVNFTTSATGGSGVYTFRWTVSVGLVCTASTTDLLVCVGNVSGAQTVSVAATDSNEATGPTATLSAYTVYAQPALPALKVTHPESVDVGTTVSFYITTPISEGSGGLTYNWAFAASLDCAVQEKSPNVLQCTPTAAGVFTVNLTATDSNGFTTPISSSGPYPVYSRPVATLTVSPRSILQGSAVTFNASYTGGAPGAVSVVWTELPSGCTGGTSLVFTCKPTTAGSYTIEVTITDANKAAATGYTNLTVQPTFIGLPADLGYTVVIGAIVGGVAVVTFVLVRRARKGKTERQSKEF